MECPGQSPEINELAAALAEAQGEMEGAVKDKKNPHFKSDYASVESTWKACKGVLSKHGLSVSINPMPGPEPRCVVMTGRLFHKSGQWISLGAIPMYGKNESPHSLGSNVTYGWRYLVQPGLGLPPIDAETAKDDDDGNRNAEPGKGSSWKAPPATKPPEREIEHKPRLNAIWGIAKNIEPDIPKRRELLTKIVREATKDRDKGQVTNWQVLNDVPDDDGAWDAVEIAVKAMWSEKKRAKEAQGAEEGEAVDGERYPGQDDASKEDLPEDGAPF